MTILGIIGAVDDGHPWLDGVQKGATGTLLAAMMTRFEDADVQGRPIFVDQSFLTVLPGITGIKERRRAELSKSSKSVAHPERTDQSKGKVSERLQTRSRWSRGGKMKDI
jgi:hypothetical protein